MDVILTRRSIRKYTEMPVSAEIIGDILKAAMAAPSAGNQQPWHFILLSDREAMDKIPEFHPYSQMLKEAPMAILVCGDVNLDKYGGMWVQDCAAATQNILLAAHAKGLGAVWVGVYPSEERMLEMRKLLGIPENVTPFSIVPIGHPAEEKPAADRYDKTRVHFDKW